MHPKFQTRSLPAIGFFRAWKKRRPLRVADPSEGLNFWIARRPGAIDHFPDADSVLRHIGINPLGA
jgi:hypothetical protein